MFSRSTSSRKVTEFEGNISNPGPTMYDPNNPIGQDFKHYGFLEKANRWKNQSKETLNGSDYNEPHQPDADEFSSTSSVMQSAPLIPKQPRGEREEIAKMKKQMERLELNYERQLAIHEKETFMLGERCHKLDGMLQSAIKEKNLVATTIGAREREIDALEHKQTVLRSKLEKAEKASIALKEKQTQSDLLQKKVEELSKQQEKFKNISKTSADAENLRFELKTVRLQLSNLHAEKESIAASLEQSKADRKSYKSKSVELATNLHAMKEEWQAREAKYREEARELSKRLSQQEAKMMAQKSDFTTTAQGLYSTCAEQKKEFETEKSSFESQQHALLSRINQLESDLQITERSLLDKDRQIDQTCKKLTSLELDLTKTHESAISMEKERAAYKEKFKREKGHHEQKLRDLQANFKNAQLDHEKQLAHFETVIASLEGNIDDLKVDREAMDGIIEEKEQSLATLNFKLDEANKELQQLSEKIEESEHHIRDLGERENELLEKIECDAQLINVTKDLLEKSKSEYEFLLKSSQEKIQLANNRISSLEDSMDENVSSLNETVQMLKADKGHLQSRVIELQGSFENTKAEFLDQIDQYEQELATTNAELEAALVNYNGLKSSTDEVITRLESEVESVHQKLEDSQDVTKQSKAEFQSLSDRHLASIESLKAEIAGSKDIHLKNESVLSGKISLLEECLQKNRIEMESLNFKLQESQQTVLSLEQFRASEKSSNSSHAQRLTYQLQEREDAARNLEITISSLSSELTAKKEELKNAEVVHEKELAILESKLLASENNIKELHSAIEILEAKSAVSSADARTSINDVVDLRIANSLMEEKISDLEFSIEDQKTDITYYQSVSEGLQKDLLESENNLQLQCEISAIQDSIIWKLLAQNEKLMNGSSESLIGNETLDTQILLQQDILSIQSATFSKSDQIDKLLETGGKQTIQNAVSAIQVETLMKSKDLFQMAFSSMSSTAEELVDSVIESFLQTNDLELRYEEISQKLEEVSNNMFQSQETTEVELSKSHAQIKELVSAMNEKSLESDNFKVTSEELQKHVEVLTETISSNNSLFQIELCKVSNLEECLKTADNELSELKSHNDEITQKLRETDSIVKELRAEKDSLNLALNETTISLAKIANQLTASKQEISTQKLELENVIEEHSSKISALTVSMERMRESSLAKESQLEAEIIAKSSGFEEEQRLNLEKLKEIEERSKTMLQNANAEFLRKTEILESEYTVEIEGARNIANCAQQELILLQEEMNEALAKSDGRCKELAEEVVYVDSLCVKLTSDLQEKQADFQSTQNELLQTRAEYEVVINGLRKEEDSLRRQLSEGQLYFQEEKASLVAEKSEAFARLEELELHSKARDLQTQNLKERNAELLEELQRFKNNGKVEFGAYRERNAELENKVKSQAIQFERYVQENSVRFSEKNGQVHSLEQQLSDSLSTISRWEIHVANEVSGRDLIIKTLESKAKDTKRSLERAEAALKESQKEIVKWKAEAEFSAATRVDPLMQDKAKDMQREISELQHQLQEREQDELALIQEVEMLKVNLNDCKISQMNEKENFDEQLQLLEERGKLESTETKRISELNAEIFGHVNTKQKIKHVEKLKDDNVNLRDRLFALTRERDVFKRKLLTTERELELQKSTNGLGGNRTRVERSFIHEGHSNVFGNQSFKKIVCRINAHEEKENDEGSNHHSFLGEGLGISYVVD